MTIEQCKEFINDSKYKDVVEYFLSAFKRIDTKIDLIINDDNCPYSDYEKHSWLNNTCEDIGEIAVKCIDLLERAYYD